MDTRAEQTPEGSRHEPNAAIPPPPDHTAPAPGGSRRDFLGSVLRKAAYALPVVVVLGSGSEALANSKDGIAWSQCQSFGDPCGAAQCCPGYHCVSIPVPMCQPFIE